MENMFLELLYAIICVAIPIITRGVLSWLASKKEEADKLVESTEYAICQKYIDNAVEIISAVVTEVSQTFVDEMKESGKWDAAAALTAKNTAVAKINIMLSSAAKDCIKQAYGDVGSFVDIYVEAAVKGMK